MNEDVGAFTSEAHDAIKVKSIYISWFPISVKQSFITFNIFFLKERNVKQDGHYVVDLSNE